MHTYPPITLITSTNYTMTTNALAVWANTHPGYTPTQAFDKLNKIVDQVRAAIAAHPNTHINNITID